MLLYVSCLVFVADTTTQSTDKNVRDPIPAGQLQSSYEPNHEDVPRLFNNAPDLVAG